MNSPRSIPRVVNADPGIPQPAAVSDEAVERELLLAEYKCLRDEVLKKMDHRTTFVISSITVSSAVLGFGLERTSAPLLLVSPLVSLLLGMLVYFHNTQIGELSEYIKANIEDKLRAPNGSKMDWHSAHPDYKFRFKARFMSYHLPLVSIAMTPAIVAIPLSLSNFEPLALALPLIVIDGVLVILYFTYIALNRREV